MNQILESQQTPHTSPSRASYGVSFVTILEKTDRVITAPHCICICVKIVWKLHIMDAEPPSNFNQLNHKMGRFFPLQN